MKYLSFFVATNTEYLVNPFLTSVPFPYQKFSDVLRGCRNGTLAGNELNREISLFYSNFQYLKNCWKYCKVAWNDPDERVVNVNMVFKTKVILSLLLTLNIFQPFSAYFEQVNVCLDVAISSMLNQSFVYSC